ncbi:organic cation transporter protein-like [Maniola jurtina]|uniref:organic cation transporter protein-like n=1 Tax=Maniola jurtina TaxID=191418 RepID=UPI001E68A058|nr:organic cation transporter protein-like [Maniola jurtina]XP_045769655.1 organic cation transporter protein-like [Maniola jurtina]XP_045769656.1 organic cation transporter protein-like [Maniola jurtina]XP_045769657.1 organic cation transporter protein-like [Maniola jurtina]
MSTEDAIETVIGRFGKYQTWILFLISLGRFPTEYQLVNVVFILPNAEFVCMDEEAYNMTNYCPCKNPQYDQTYIVKSVTTNWDLICEKRQLASLAQSMLHVGILGGSIFYGHLSDRYGRKLACLLALFCEVLFVALSAAVPKFWMFVVFRFLIGTAVGGSMLCCYVYVVELSGKSFRPYLTALMEISYLVSYFTLPIIAYFLRDWRHLQMATSLPWSFVLFYYFLIPESPRWLLTTGKKEKAIEVLTYIAKKNKRSTENIRTVVDKIQEEANSNNKEQFGSYLDLFKTPKIRTYTLLTAFVWTCCAFTFFGINQYIGTLQGNLYLNVLLSATSLLPGVVLVLFASLYLRRKIGVVTSFVVASLSLLVFMFIPKYMDSVELVFAVIGQLGVYTAFTQIYLFTSEIFPTIVRNSAMGFVSVFARFGSFTAPFAVNIGIEWVSITIFSVSAFIAACLCYFLPETKDSVLLNTIEQTEKSGDRKV